jgi:adenosyl cobinamide kinase/adenosyl cobinamide phosphate guanylyltransferase
MATSEKNVPAADPLADLDAFLADLHAVLERIATGKSLDSEMAHRIRERAQRITEEIRQKHGKLDIAVQLIRESRDEA